MSASQFVSIGRMFVNGRPLLTREIQHVLFKFDGQIPNELFECHLIFPFVHADKTNVCEIVPEDDITFHNEMSKIMAMKS
jgi:hypothetical protein